MAKRNQKKRYIAPLLALFLIIIFLAIVIIKKPAITGKVVQGQQAVYSQNLNLQKNQSGSYEWLVNNPGNIISLKATGSVTSNGTAKVYIEKNGTKYLIFDSTKQLFDVNVHVLPEYKKIPQGGDVLIQIALLNLRGFGAGYVNVSYSIKDSKGSILAIEQEPVFVETSAKFIRKLELPKELAPGIYVASVEAFTSVIIGTGSDTIEITGQPKNNNSKDLRFFLILFFSLIVILTAFTFSIRGIKSLKKKREIAMIKEKMPLERIRKFEKELKALEEAKKSGFLSEKSYEKEKKRIEDKLGVEKE